MVALKYCNATMRCDEVIDGDGGPDAPPAELRCTFEELPAELSSEAASAAAAAGMGVVGAVAVDEKVVKRSRPKGNISWVSAEQAVRAEVRLYNHLFSVDSPDDNWEQQVREMLIDGVFFFWSSPLFVSLFPTFALVGGVLSQSAFFSDLLTFARLVQSCHLYSDVCPCWRCLLTQSAVSALRLLLFAWRVLEQSAFSAHTCVGPSAYTMVSLS